MQEHEYEWVQWYATKVRPDRAQAVHLRQAARATEARRRAVREQEQHDQRVSRLAESRHQEHLAAMRAEEHKRRCRKPVADLAWGLHRMVRAEGAHVLRLFIGLRKALEWAVAQQYRERDAASILATRKASDERKAQAARRAAREALVPTRKAPPKVEVLTYQPFSVSMAIRLHPAGYTGLCLTCDSQSRERYEAHPVVKHRHTLEHKLAAGGTLTPDEWNTVAASWRNTSSVPTDDALCQSTVSLDTEDSYDSQYWLRAEHPCTTVIV